MRRQSQRKKKGRLLPSNSKTIFPVLMSILNWTHFLSLVTIVSSGLNQFGSINHTYLLNGCVVGKAGWNPGPSLIGLNLNFPMLVSQTNSYWNKKLHWAWCQRKVSVSAGWCWIGSCLYTGITNITIKRKNCLSLDIYLATNISMFYDAMAV